MSSARGGNRESKELFRQKTFLLDPIKTAVQAALETIEQLIDLRTVDDQRWTEGEAIAEQRPRDHTFFLRQIEHVRGDQLRRIEILLRLLVGDEFDAADQTDPGRFTHKR